MEHTLFLCCFRSFSIAKYDFEIKIAGSCQEAVLNLLDTCYAPEVDVIGCDMNSGVALRKTHVTSPVVEAMKEFCHKHAVTLAFPYESLYGQAAGDCCGFIIMPTSPIVTECTVLKHGWMPFWSDDIGVRRTDREMHHPNHLWLQSKSHVRKYKRSAEGWDRVQAKKAQKREALSEKKKAQKMYCA